MKEWMDADLSALDIMVVQIDGIHITEHLVLVAAIGIDGEGVKHPLGLIEGATEHGAVGQALIDDLVERGLDPAVPRLFIIDGSKALAKPLRRSFGPYRPPGNHLPWPPRPLHRRPRERPRSPPPPSRT